MLVALALLAAQIAAPTPQQADARCLAALATMSDLDPTDKTKQAALNGSMYFLGKLLGRDPRADLAALLKEASPAVAINPKAALGGCAAELQRAGGAMIAAGAALESAPAK